MTKPKRQPSPLFLGIECGGTRSVAILARKGSREAIQYEAGPANLRLLNDAQLVEHFQKISSIHQKASIPAAICIGMAGARTISDRDRIRRAAANVWPGVGCYITNDVETALAAAQAPGGREMTRVLILSGTGSCVFGQTPEGKRARVGGWGHVIGDKGSGYEIGLHAVKSVVYQYDRKGVFPPLGQQLLRSLQLTEPDDFISWAQSATKKEIGALAIEVFHAWSKKDPIATEVLESAAASLARDGACCASRLSKRDTPVQFVTSGGVLTKQPKFARLVARELRRLWPKAIVTQLKRDSTWGAVALAQKVHGHSAHVPTVDKVSHITQLPALTTGLPITERRNPLSLNLDQLPVEEMINLMLREDGKIPDAIFAERKKIEEAINVIIRAFRRGGRMFYIGAGTSGRLGVLDASECPPTFGTPPEMVQGVIAGGQMALWRSIEGAEDDMHAGAEVLKFAGLCNKDVVVGIAASGRTPYVWGALLEAKQRGAATVLLSFNPNLQIAPKDRPDIIILPDVGPEILTGSTRLKAGTATKLVLNMLTTISMVKLGKVVGNLMIDMNASNIKLRDRAVRIVTEIAGVDAGTAWQALEKSNWKVKNACRRLKRLQAVHPGAPFKVYQTAASSAAAAGPPPVQRVD